MKTVSGPTDHVVVVGAGMAGLSAALYLLGAGRSVTLLERADEPGGRVGGFSVDGTSIDAGATILTMPDLIDHALAAVGDDLANRVDLHQLHPAYHANFADGSTLALHTSAGAMEAEIRDKVGPADAAGYLKLRSWLTSMYQAEMDSFISANFDSPTDLLSRDLAQVAVLGGFGRLDKAIARFVSDPRLHRMFSFQALFAGLAPQQALALYSVIPYMDTVSGVYFPKGGMRALARGLAAAIADAGGTVRLGTNVAWLERVGSRVTAVRTSDGERIACDAVVLTPELPTSYQLLGLSSRRMNPYNPARLAWSPSAVVMHAVTDKPFPQLGHHNIFFGHEWHRTFQEITRDGVLMSDPSLLVTAPTMTEPTLAAAGKHQLSILAPCPNTEVGAIDWERIGPVYADELRGTLEQRGLHGLSDSIEWSQLITPRDWAAQGLAAGTPFSAAHTFRQTGPFRPRNLVARVDNAVLAGCGTTPGVGIPPTVISGRLAAARITGTL